jgi:beta-glucosidase
MAGLDMDMTGPDAYWGSNLVAAVNASEVTASRLNDMATRILPARYKLGQDTDYPKVAVNSQDISGAPQVEVQGNHKKTIRDIGGASAVLLKNVNQTLPLSKPKSIGIFGNDAGSANYGPLGCTELPCLSGTIAS